MTTVCFLLPGLSACRGHQRLGGGTVIGLLAAKGLGERHRAGGGGLLHAASTSPLHQPVPSAAWSWAPRSGPSSCPRPALPSSGGRCCGPTSHRHHCCCSCCYSHHHPRGSLAQRSHLVTGSQPVPVDLQPYSPHLGLTLHLEAQGSWDSDSNHDPSLLAILT